jgi:hypothetical protein
MESKILFLVDTTGSMGNYINSLKPSIVQLSQLISLLGTNTKVAILGYKDQSDQYPVIWSKWLDPSDPELINFISHLSADGGSNDFCESSKLAVNIAIEECANTDQALVIHYTDAPPHAKSFYFGNYSQRSGNDIKEKNTLTKLKYPYDWLDICKRVHEKNLSFVTLCSRNNIYGIDVNIVMAYYALLGQVLYLENPTSTDIAQTTIDVILSQFKGSVITSHRSFELKKTFQNEDELGAKDAIPPLDAYEYFPKRKVFENFPTTTQLIKKFQENAERLTTVQQGLTNRTVSQPYRDLVYATLDKVMNTTEGVFSLTYNPFFGSLWRIVAAFARIDERSVELSNKLSREMGKLDQRRLAIVKEWLEESYNKEEEVQELIKSVTLTDDSKVFIIDMKEPVTKRQLMDVMRGTADNVSTGKVIRFLSTVQTVPFKDIPNYKKEKMYYIPVDLPSTKVMAIISHLIAPGIIMSIRPAAIISILTCLALEPSSELYVHASKYLERECDQWIDVHKSELADNYSTPFINIINQLRSKDIFPEFLSDREKLFYDNLTMLIKVTKNLNKYITVQTPYTTKNKQRQQYDHTLECKDCKKMRSFTVMHTPTQCGPCYLVIDTTTAPIVEKMTSFNATYSDTIKDLQNLPTQLSDKTNLFTCESCKCYYSVIDPTKLNVKPKCHFCRSGQSKVTSKCVVCSNEFIDEARLLSKFGDRCGQCTHTSESFEDLKITIRSIFQKSPGLLELFGISSASVGYLSSNKTLYKACTSTPPDVYFVPPIDEPDDQYFWSNAYHNQQLILQILRDEINEGATESECLLCYNTFPLKQLKPACGNCTHQLCEPCAKGWYSQNSPGNVVLETYSRCPFCKQMPKFDVIKNYNRILCQFNNRKHKFDPSSYEAWCLTCGIISEFAAKECANDIPSLDGQFRCAVCKMKEDKLDPSEFQKECPGCGVMTFKAGGCNHMTCVMDGCKTHWCWKCRWKSTPGSIGIYDHLRKEHGGTYDFEANNNGGHYDQDDDYGTDNDDDYY